MIYIYLVSNIVMPNKKYYTFYFTVNFSNHSGFYTIIEKRPIKSHNDYYVENWKLSLPKSKCNEKILSVFLLDTNVYYEDNGNPIVYNETFASLDECKKIIEDITDKFKNSDISWSINPKLDTESYIIFIVFNNTGQILDKGVL